MKPWLAITLASLLSSNAYAEEDPAEIALGERLFLETRFAQAYASNPAKADPVMATTQTTSTPLAGPFKGKHMNCRACHLVDEHAANKNAGMRSYADFSKRPPMPRRKDGHTHSERHSQQLINIHVDEKNDLLFHFDGEFASLTDLVMGTYTGRNFGWLNGEKDKAIKHVATIIRNDDGQDELGKEFGGSYKTLLADKKLPAEYRVDVNTASDMQLFTAAAKLVAAYVSDLGFSRNANGEYNGSPYDKFLELNNLPRKPEKHETDLQYSRRLLQAINKLDKPVFVSSKHGKFASHAQAFRFAEQELAGMELFFADNPQKKTGKTGNCIACHAAPHFSDYSFHNTGVSQAEYDGVHGNGAFMRLDVPTAEQRSKNPDAYLPASHSRPTASNKFRSVPARSKPGYTDLGAWNVVLNSDMPKPQPVLKKMLCDKDSTCSDDQLLNRAFAAFKTPVLRDLGHSAPYLHDGSASDIEHAIQHYIDSTALLKSGIMRNPAKQLENINITAADIAPLTAFIRALNEDYE